MNEPAASPAFDVLRRLMRRRPAVEGDACDVCSAPIPPEHGHLVDLESRSLSCACRACYLLFTQPGAARGRYRAVPDRYVDAGDLGLTDAEWDVLQVPVGLAFFFANSRLGRTVALYPGPAGATESLLPLSAWDRIVERNRAAAGLAADVEALLVRRSAGFQCYVVPIDVCYELVGRLRRVWKGFDGGDEARGEIEAFFERVRERSGDAGASPGRVSGEPAA